MPSGEGKFAQCSCRSTGPEEQGRKFGRLCCRTGTKPCAVSGVERSVTARSPGSRMDSQSVPIAAASLRLPEPSACPLPCRGGELMRRQAAVRSAGKRRADMREVAFSTRREGGVDAPRRSGTFHYDRVASEPGMAALSVVKRAVPHRMEYGTGIWKRLLKDQRDKYYYLPL